MHKNDVRNPGQALAYITDCNLATVCDMAGKKSRPKAEFERQKRIAQQGVDWMHSMGVDCSSTRANDVLKAGSVDAWAATFMPKI